MGIVLEPDKNTQTFFTLHKDDITAMDISRDGKFAVTGEVGPKPLVAMWETESKKLLWKTTTPLAKGIACIALNPSITLAAAVSINEGGQFPYAIYNAKDGAVVASDKSGPDFILDIVWSDDQFFATAGPQHFYVWDSKAPSDKKKQPDSAKSNMYSTVGAFKGKFYCGAAEVI